MAFFHTELSRDGPGLLLRDIQKEDDPQILAVLSVLAEVQPDIVVLGGIDWDYEARAIDALRQSLSNAGHAMPHVFSGTTNRGRPSGFDLDGDGRVQEPEDAVGFARFTGQNSLAVLSRYPIDRDAIYDDSLRLWQDVPDALLPYPGQPDGLETTLPISTTSHWIVPVRVDDQTVHVGTFFATAPVFDGPEDRNGRRNHDEIAYWTHLLDGGLNTPRPNNFVLAGHANLDPNRGAGRRSAIQSLLNDPRLSDPHGDVPTVNWRRDDLEDMRVSYVLPDTSWAVSDAGVYWPSPDTPERATAERASRHRLVWVDIRPMGSSNN